MSASRRFAGAVLSARLANRGDLLASALGCVMLGVVGPVFVLSLMSHLPSLGGWTGPEMLFCWGFAEAGSGIFYVLFQGLLRFNQRYLLGGELDRLLVRPMDPLLQLLLENLGLDELPGFVIGLGILGAAVAWGVPGAIPRLVLLPVALLAAAATLGGVATGLCSLGFYLQHRGTAIGMAMQLSAFSRYPLDLFPAPLVWLLSTLLPLGFAGFYGALVFLDRPMWWVFAVAQPIVGAVTLWAGVALWRAGLRSYASSGT